MKQVRRTIQGLSAMSALSRRYLGEALLASCGILALAILVAVAASASTYRPYAIFTLTRASDAVARFGSLPLYVGIYRSVKAAAQEKR